MATAVADAPHSREIETARHRQRDTDDTLRARLMGRATGAQASSASPPQPAPAARTPSRSTLQNSSAATVPPELPPQPKKAAGPKLPPPRRVPSPKSTEDANALRPAREDGPEPVPAPPPQPTPQRAAADPAARPALDLPEEIAGSAGFAERLRNYGMDADFNPVRLSDITKRTDGGDAAAGSTEIPAATREVVRNLTDGAQAATKPSAAQTPVADPTPALALFKARRDGELWSAISAGRDALTATALFSFVINLLMLTGPLFMLQVYDRVMTSGSIPTLVALSVLTAALYVVIGTLEMIRSRVVVRVGLEFDRRVADRVFTSSLRRSLSGQAGATTALRELDHIRQFIGGPGPLSLFDAPWTPVYLLVIFLMHWALGIAATIGALVLLALAWASERMTRAPLMEAGRVAGQSFEMAETGARNAEAITAMGMLEAYRARWQNTNAEAMAWQVVAADRLGTLQAIIKTTRLGLQSLMLAIGAALALSGDISAGTIVAATIIFGRALAPVEQAIGHWRGMLRALDGYGKIDMLLRATPEPPARTALPDPKGHLKVAGLRVAAPDSRQLILSNISFEVRPGKMLAVIGPSASGKSTLARTLVGLWQPLAGSVQLDGARLDQWDPDALGRHIGYLPQSVELFSGTVKDNIARFRADATDAEIIAAAQQAHAHELILALPNGYETQLGSFGTYLSAGQRQRIALARALFGNPRLVVLDEPNANLDRVGDDALDNAIDGMRSRGQAVVLVSHRVQAIGKADLLLYVDRGIQRAFGPRDEVMRMLQGGSAKPAAPGAPSTEPEPS